LGSVTDSSVAPAGRPRHWIVRTHYLHRTFLFANAFAFSAAHVWERSPSIGLWALLAAIFLVYPQAIYWRTLRSPDPQKAELQNLILDCFLVAVPIAIMGFPLWIWFAMFITTTINNAFAGGLRGGLLPALGAYALGSMLGGAFTGFQVATEHNELVTALCVFALTWFLLSIGNVAYERALKLRATREELKRRIAEIDALQVQLRDQANRDPLTALFNRRYLQSTMERELARCQREQTSLCVMMLDIDFFKSVNDRYGHPAGDEVLIQLAKLLISGSRLEDVPCRWGGEEFMVLMPKMPLAVAKQRAEDWRRSFATLSVKVGGKDVGSTISIGIAEFPTHSRNGQELIECADQALYRAKAGGRDRVVCYDRIA
jgi:diguanylate cyclase